jgi:hypothetical protein
MNLWKKLFGKNDNEKEIIVAVVVENDLKIFRSINEASRYLTENKLTSALERIKKLKSDSGNGKNVKAIKINDDNNIIEYSSLERLKEDSYKLK